MCVARQGLARPSSRFAEPANHAAPTVFAPTPHAQCLQAATLTAISHGPGALMLMPTLSLPIARGVSGSAKGFVRAAPRHPLQLQPLSRARPHIAFAADHRQRGACCGRLGRVRDSQGQ